mmetsp:Transcript_25942/g.34036  ORF Transcript_25942/g.34036 Transcript_25942/m.34036 type:complete len:290 (-) Transcript_25942:119-988(-)
MNIFGYLTRKQKSFHLFLSENPLVGDNRENLEGLNKLFLFTPGLTSLGDDPCLFEEDPCFFSENLALRLPPTSTFKKENALGILTDLSSISISAESDAVYFSCAKFAFEARFLLLQSELKMVERELVGHLGGLPGLSRISRLLLRPLDLDPAELGRPPDIYPLEFEFRRIRVELRSKWGNDITPRSTKPIEIFEFLLFFELGSCSLRLLVSSKLLVSINVTPRICLLTVSLSFQNSSPIMPPRSFFCKVKRGSIKEGRFATTLKKCAKDIIPSPAMLSARPFTSNKKSL